MPFKPLVKLKKWHPRSPKNMTLIAGFNCRDGLLICADMEQVSGASSRRVNKLFHGTIQGEWSLVVTGAGSGAVIDNVVDKLWKKVSNEEKYDEAKMEDAITKVLTSAYKKYVWPDKRNDHRINLIIGYINERSLQKSLWITHDLVPMPEGKHVCAGAGEDLANYLADRLWHPFYSESQAVRMATFIFKEVKDNVADVGRGTQMWMLRTGGRAMHYDRQEIAGLEAGLPSFDYNVFKFGKDITGSLFPLLPFTLNVPHKEICTDPLDKNYFEGPKGIGAKDLGKITFI